MVVLEISPNKFEKITLTKNNFAFSFIVELDEIIANFFVWFGNKKYLLRLEILLAKMD